MYKGMRFVDNMCFVGVCIWFVMHVYVLFYWEHAFFCWICLFGNVNKFSRIYIYNHPSEHTYRWIHIYMQIKIWKYIFKYLYMDECIVSNSIYIHLCIHTYEWISIWKTKTPNLFIYIWVYIDEHIVSKRGSTLRGNLVFKFMYVCMYVCVYVCMHMWTSISSTHSYLLCEWVPLPLRLNMLAHPLIHTWLCMYVCMHM